MIWLDRLILRLAARAIARQRHRLGPFVAAAGEVMADRLDQDRWGAGRPGPAGTWIPERGRPN